MRIATHCITLAVGMFLLGYATVSKNRPIDVWSEFKAFSARVAGDEAARHVLTYGGEKDETDFEYLLNRVWRLSDDWSRVVWSGILLCGVVVAGIALEITQKRKKQIIESGNRGF